MGFAGLFGYEVGGKKKRAPKRNKLTMETLHAMECAACPLNPECASGPEAAAIQGNRSPNMAPTGSDEPVVYVLGEAPGENEDLEGAPFVGKSGLMIRHRIPAALKYSVRFNNVVRTRPPDNRDPKPVEIECCRPSVIRDIEATQPVAIFAMGDHALRWFTGQGGVTLWSGERIPVKVGEHVCWMFPMMHPAYIGYVASKTPMVGEDLRFTFDLHMRQAFRQIDAGLPEPVVHTREDALHNITIINGNGGDTDLDALSQWFGYLHECERIGYDIETTSTAAPAGNERNLRPYDGGPILTASFSDGVATVAFAVDHPGAGWAPEQRLIVRRMFSEFLHNYSGEKAAHNAAFEMEWSAFNFGSEMIWGSRWLCTQSQAYVLNCKPGKLGLEDVIVRLFGINIKKLHTLNKDRLDLEPVDTVLEYNGVDSKYAKLAADAQEAEIEEAGLTEQAFYHYIRIPATVLTQLKGVPIDQERVGELADELDQKLTAIEAEIAELKVVRRFRELKNTDFRPSAERDIKFVFDKILNQPIEKADEPTLSKIKHPIAKAVLDWRENNKLWSTYVRPLQPIEWQPEYSRLYPDGMAHPQLKTMAVRTTRTSSDGPNSENYPKHEHKEVRRQMKHRFKKAVSFDYSGIQARNIAMESLDATLIQAFKDDYDIHQDWRDALLMLDPNWIPYDDQHDKDRMKYWRGRAKNEFVFPSFFGAQPYSISQNMHVDERHIQRLQEELWERFPDVLQWQKDVKEFYRQNGYVTGLSGFRRPAPVGPNEIINAPIQADETIIVLTAMAELSQYQEPRFQPELEVHDDLSFWWDVDDIKENARTVIQHMLMTPFEWTRVVPIQVEMSIGDDWASTDEKAVFRTNDDHTGWLQTKEKDGWVL